MKFRSNLAVVGFFLFAALAWPPSAGSEIYKWVDERGVTHYSESAPSPGTRSSTVRVPERSPSDDAAFREQAQQRFDEANRRRADRKRELDLQREREEAAQRSVADRVARCSFARRQLATLKLGRAVYRRDEKGERRYLDDSDFDAEVVRYQKEVSDFCDGTSDGVPADDAKIPTRIPVDRRELCTRAHETLRELEASGRQVPAWEIEAARERARRTCGESN